MLVTVLKPIGLIISLYLLLSAIPYLFERKFIFRGKSLSQEYKFQFNCKFQEHFITLSDSTVINALFFKTPKPSKGLIFYCHGNADNLVRWGQYTNEFTERGYDVFAFDYRGYGKSSGRPEHDLLLGDAKELYQWTINNIEGDNRIIYGRSLGAAVASNLATVHHPRALFLETPFDNIRNVFRHRFSFLLELSKVKNNFSNLLSLEKPRSYPVHIFHGTKDKVVPLDCAKNLKSLLNEHDSFTIIPEGGHRNLASFPFFQEALDRHLGSRN